VTVGYDKHPERFLGTGTVFIAWDDSEEDPGYRAYGDALPDEKPGLAIEEGPRARSLGEVVEWGRERTPRVLIRPESDPGEYYWAGIGEPTGEYATLKRLPF
jgi:hypothetical protein